MCGIIGVTGTGAVAPRLIDSLKRLEYRGYDSAGIAAPSAVAPRQDRNLEAVLAEAPLNATVGIGHTRWATQPPAHHPGRSSRISPS
jgi:glucosamine--fructose-6-phosphate aminotransferase (isomerizing)